MYFDRFDVCEAWYLYAAAYHGGQNTKLYRVLGRLSLIIRFRPAMGLNGPEDLTENGRAIYDRLVAGMVYQ